MPTLDHITIKGFKSVASIERLDLRPINVVIGANGAGKSNFIEAFAFLHEVRQGRLQSAVAKAGGADRVLHFGNKRTETATFELSFDEGVNGYALDLEPTEDDRLVPVYESVRLWDKALYDAPYSERVFGSRGEAGISNPKAGIASHVREYLTRWRVYHFEDTSATSPMKRTAEVSDNRALKQDASNLAAFLRMLRDNHGSEYSLIRRGVQRVAPFFEEFQLEPLVENEEAVRLEWRHRESDDYFDAASFSDGTLRFVALATLLLQPVAFRPSVILIDEPELGLHPYAITLLASLIKQASVDTQVIVATQSALLLDHFEPQDVLVAERANGGTELRRLDPKPLEAWLEEYSLGELWEKNEIGGRPGGR